MLHIRSLLLPILCLLLSACSLSENDTPRNLVITDINTGPVVTLEQQAPLEIFYNLEVQGLSNINTDVYFYLIHHNEIKDSNNSNEQTVEDIHQFAVVSLSELSEGNHALSVWAELPHGLEGGDYQIIAHVDPNNTVIEDIEEDNSPSPNYAPFANGQYPHSDIAIALISTHDFSLKDTKFGQTALLLDAPHIESGTSHHHADLIGYVIADYEGNELDHVQLTAEALVNGTWERLHFWSTSKQQYLDSLPYLFNHDLHDQHIGFDIALEDDLISALYANHNAQEQVELEIRFTLSDLDAEGDLDPSNNIISTSIPLFFFEGQANRSANIKLAQSYDKSYGDQSKFSVGVDLSGQLLIVPAGDPGARITAEGNVEAYFFNAQNTLFAISYDGSAYVSGLNTGYSSEMIIFNNVVFEDESYTSKFEKSWTKSWEEEKVLAKANFTIGPIPMSVEAGVNGGLGFELTVGYNAELYANGDLFSVNFGAFGRGGVDLAVASAGVQAEFNLIDNVFSLDSTAGFSLTSNDNTQPHIYYALELSDEIDVISGKFGLYAETKGVKWCKKWGIPYPCGTKVTRYDLWLYQTASVFQKSWTLFSQEGSVNL
ncbi:hypothetical protein PALB_37320 [Pseudoalteromonas luteoviolacea B = ATCC 29581]|nr:hypothetical protein PALB_37320 [Pseudoalteromonas luteoviolacea B = ATCC 29581]